MTDAPPPIVVLLGAGGGTADPALFRAGIDDRTPIEAIPYPGWPRYISRGYTAQMLIEDLTATITSRFPHGPVRIVGMSIGGHFGYAIALCMQKGGRAVTSFCAIDTFMVSSAAASPGWKGRALKRSLILLRERRLGPFVSYFRSLFWRLLMRAAGHRLPALVRLFAPSGRLPRICRVDPLLEKELSMRLLIRKTAPWIASLDREPESLNVPAILFRTKFTSTDDAAWRRRCPQMQIVEVPGNHETMFEGENLQVLHERFVSATRGSFG